MSQSDLASKPAPLVQVQKEVLNGYPLLTLRERDLTILPPFVFTSMSYQRPSGSSKIGSAEIELFSPKGEFSREKIYFEFLYSEQERIEDARRAESFKLRPGVGLKPAREYEASDFENTYRDVIIDGVRLTKEETETLTFELNYHFSPFFVKTTTPTEHKVLVTINLTDFGKSDVQSLTETIQVNVLQLLRENEVKTVAKTINELEHFELNTDFLKGGPPLTVSSKIIVPRPYIELVTIDYFPPKDVFSREAQVLVEYRLNGRLFSERVTFQFGHSIQEEASRLIQSEPLTLYRYLPTIRRVPPINIDEHDFSYNGRLPIRIIGVEYDSSKIDVDARIINITLLVEYRTAIVRLKKPVEFQYSLNEYINEGETKARIENRSISFSEVAIDIDKFYTNVNVSDGTLKKPKLMMTGLTINENYPYKAVKEVKLINFDASSRTQMFKVTVEELYGAKTITRSFEKHVVMEWSYQEWALGKLTVNDIEIDPAYMPSYPPKDLSERIIAPSPLYKVVSLQYQYPGDEAKAMDVQVELESGARTISLVKHFEFAESYRTHRTKEREAEERESLRALKASDFTLVIDTRKKAPLTVLPSQVLGVPQGISVNVIYNPPKPGERSTRIIIELSRNNYTTGFEQTLIFDEAS